MKRVVVVGVTGSGKTTLARRISQTLGLPYIELDSLHWLPNWTERPVDEFRAKLVEVSATHCWVVDGNYSKARDVIWPHADTIVWLDYPLWLIMWRLLRRTIRRVVAQENLWNSANKETWHQQFLSRDSLFLWALRTYRRRKREYPSLFNQPENAHLNVIHLRSPFQTENWLGSLRVEDD